MRRSLGDYFDERADSPARVYVRPRATRTVEMVRPPNHLYDTAMAVAPDDVVLRDSARVVLVDGAWRALLVRVVDPTTNEPPLWVTPGGGIEAGEDRRETAARELWEETGLRVAAAALVGPVAVTSGDWTFRGVTYRSTDWYFAHQCDEFEPCDTAATDIERDIHAEWRWWTADETDAATEMIIPARLSIVIRSLAQGRPTSSRPIRLPWES